MSMHTQNASDKYKRKNHDSKMFFIKGMRLIGARLIERRQ